MSDGWAVNAGGYMENENSTTGTLATAAPEDQVERLTQAMAQFAQGDVVEIELYRVIGSGRGANGEHEFLESMPWDTADGRGIGEVIREVQNHLRDQHGGGRFRLQVRDDKTGQLRMNQAASVVRRATPPVSAAPENSMTTLLTQLAADRRADAERLERLLSGLQPPAVSEDALLDRMVRYKTLFGGNDKGTDLLDALDKVMGIRERFDNFGAPPTDPWAELLRDFGPDLMAAMRGDGGAVDVAELPPADDAIRQQVSGFAVMLLRGAEGKVTPEQAAQFALGKMQSKAALLRFCQNEKATGLLCEVEPKLTRHVVWLEKVRAAVMKAGTPKLEGDHRANDAGKDTGRTSGRGGNPEKNAKTGRSIKEKKSDQVGGTKTGRAIGSKGLPGRSRKTA